jgi:hypothetical protein
MKTPSSLLLCAGFILAGLGTARAEGPAPHPAGHESFHRHHAGVFLGGVSRFEDGHEESGLALGVEYEYRLSPQWGVGGLIEGVTVGHGRDLALVAPVTWHPWRGLKLSLGAGVEYHDGNGEFLGRVAAGYDFHFGRWTVAPEISGDFTHEAQTIVYGIAVGFGF